MNIYSSTNKLQNDVLNVGLSLLVSIPQCNYVIISPKTGDITMLEKAKLRNIHHVFICLLYRQFSCYQSEILTSAIFRESKAFLNLNKKYRFYLMRNDATFFLIILYKISCYCLDPTCEQSQKNLVCLKIHFDEQHMHTNVQSMIQFLTREKYILGNTIQYSKLS